LTSESCTVPFVVGFQVIVNVSPAVTIAPAVGLVIGFDSSVCAKTEVAATRTERAVRPKERRLVNMVLETGKT